MKHLIILIFILLISIKNQAQTLDFLRSGGSTAGSTTASGTSAAGDNIGNIYAAGTSNGIQSFDSTHTITGYGNFLAKYNSSGSVLWLKKITGGTITQISATDNAVYLAGYITPSGINFSSQSSPDNVLYALGNKSFFIAKFDSNGNLTWAKISPTNDISQANGISVSGNSVYITGRFSNLLTFNATTLYSAGEYDIFLAKYDDSGNFQWARRAGSSNTNVIVNDEGLKLTISGNSVYLTGTFNGTANFNTPSSSGTNELISVGSYNGFVAKFDDLGTFIWAKRFGGNTVTDIATNGTSVYISGNFQSSINFSNPYASGVNQVSIPSHNYMSLFLAKFDENGNYQWAKTAHQPYAHIYKCSVDMSQNEVLFGGEGSVYHNGGYIQSTGNIFLVNYDENGTMQWNKQYTGTIQTGNPYNYFCVSANSIFFIGSFQYNMFLSNSVYLYATGSNIEFYLFKTDISGTPEWIKSAGSVNGGDDQANAATTDNQGNVYITGKFKGTMAIGSLTITSAGNDDVFVAKYNNTGNLLWAKRAGGTGADVGLGIAYSENSIYITGSFTGTANFNNPSLAGSNEIVSAGLNDVFVAKYDENGVFQWAKRAGGTGNDAGNGIAVSGTDIYLTGSFFETSNFNTPSANGNNELFSAGGYDIFIAKYDGSGSFQWAKRAGGTSVDEGKSIAIFDNAVYITGFFHDTANFNTPSSTGSNEITSVSSPYYSLSEIFLAKYDENGIFQWAKRAGGDLYDQANGIAVDENGLYIVGKFTGKINFNNPSATGSNELEAKGNEANVFLAKYDNEGNFQWAKRVGASNATGVGIAGNSVYITGSFSGTLDFNNPFDVCSIGTPTIESAGYSDVFLAKFSSNGTFKWAKRGGGSDIDEGFGLAISENSLFLTGFFRNTATFTTSASFPTLGISSIGGTDIFLAKYNIATLTFDGELIAFSACKNQPSNRQHYSVSGEFLTQNIVITVPAGFEITTQSETEEYFSSVTVTPTNGQIISANIWIRMASNAKDNPAGMINHYSAGEIQEDIAISGLVHNVPIPTAQSNMPVCSGLSLNLSSNGGTNYAWTGPNSFSSTSQNPVISNVSNSLSGIYTVLATDVNGCSATTFTQVIIISTPSLSIISNAPLSTGNTLKLFTMGGVNYQWTGPNGFVSSQQNPIVENISQSNAGNYQVTITDGNGCFVNTSINIEISNNANCPDNISLNNIENTPNTIIYSTKGSITSISTIQSNAKITYDAGKAVILNPGFAVNNGAVFNAKIGGCGNN